MFIRLFIEVSSPTNQATPKGVAFFMHHLLTPPTKPVPEITLLAPPPPSPYPPLYRGYFDVPYRGSILRLKFFWKKIGKKGKTPKSEIKIFQKFLGNFAIYLKIPHYGYD